MRRHSVGIPEVHARDDVKRSDGQLLPSPKAVGYVLLAGGALIAAVALQDAPLAALGLPALLVAAVGSLLDGAATDSAVSASMRVDQEVIRAGDKVTVKIELSAASRVRRCRAHLVVPEGLRPDRAPFWSVSLAPGVPTELSLEVLAAVPGEVTLGPLVLRTSGGGEMLERRIEVAGPLALLVRAGEQPLRTLPRSSHVRVPSGDRLARSRGEGIELAEIRPELPGERARRINWRATARRGSVHVTLRHPEQSTDVVLFADTFESQDLSRVLEVAATAAAGYLARRDRVGLVCFGGVLDWVEAGSGKRQLDRIRTRLAATSPFLSYAWKTIERIPPRALPTGALVIAITPLRDERFTSAIGEVRARGHEVIVVEIAEWPRPPRASDSPSAQAAALLTRMEREDLRQRLWRRGIAVAPLLRSDPLDVVFSHLAEARRRMRPGVRR
ncbi:MAG: DUF58 domain-containing protein [Acidimicrobiales bacterium]